MNFHDLRIVMGYLKKGTRCADCKGRFTDDDLEIIGALGDEQLLVNTWCPRCEIEALVTVHIDAQWLYGPDPELGSAPRMGHVSANEVLDMRNFLKSFNGDFDQMFKQEQSSS
jgi:hypothetical protein